MAILEDLLHFLFNAPTAWHAAMEMGNRLASKDFKPLYWNEDWKLEKGGAYFVEREGSFCAFRLPKTKVKELRIAAAHTDSPALKLKPKPQIHKKNMVLFSVEVYGGPILASWMGRDLVVSGKVITKSEQGKIEEHLVMIDDALVIIPHQAIHLMRDVNEKGLKPNPQTQLLPLVTLSRETAQENLVETLIRRYLSFHQLLHADLFLTPAEPPRFIGALNEFLAGYRLDNLAGSYAVLSSFATSEPENDGVLPLALFWDHEEIGSQTFSGAKSAFFNDVMARIAPLYNLSGNDLSVLKANSRCLSVDMAHGFHPNFEEDYDPNHQPLLGDGICLKFDASHRYTSVGKLVGEILKLTSQQNIPTQSFVGRSDKKGGSTIGPLFSSQTGIATLDIGCPQLAMHATREVISPKDLLNLTQLLTSYFEAKDL